MADDTLIEIDETLAIPRAELSYAASRSGGPGGQHVNTSATKVELRWDVAGSPSLTDAQRDRIREKLGNRMDNESVLRIVEGGSRSQHQNREAVTERFRALVAEALEKQKPRKRTRPPRRVKEKVLEEKKQRAQKKQLRKPPDF